MLPDVYNIGLTNLTDRPSKEAKELSVAEQEAGVLPFLRKVIRFRPRVVCFLGMNIWDLVKKGLIDLVPLPDAEPEDNLGTPPQPSPTQTKLITSKHFPPPLDPEPESSKKPLTLSQRRRLLKRQIKLDCPTAPGLMPFKIVYEVEEEAASPRETLFYSLPSPSARVIHFQLVDKVGLFKQFKTFMDQLKSANYQLDQTTMYEIKAADISAT
jgi:hypothetical protein